MIAVDWSHNKGLTIYDGKKLSVIDKKAFLKTLAGAGGKSRLRVQSRENVNLPAPLVILEQGCPLSLIYDILKTGCEVDVINNRASQDYRVKHGVEKTDENDAKIIYELANNGAKLFPINLDDAQMQLINLYQQYKKYQKARVALMNMRKAYIRQFWDGESITAVKSRKRVKPSQILEGEGESSLSVQSEQKLNPSPSLPYDIGIASLKTTESSCLKKIVKLAPPVPESLKIRGLGPRLWAGIIITANPAKFLNLSSYLRYCGLVNLDQLNHKWNRHARMLYHMLAEQTMKQKDEKFRSIYDKCKEDIAQKYPEYTKLHIHNAALNRTATFLAKEIYYSLNDKFIMAVQK